MELMNRRPIRSFVLRGGRLTEGQKRALDELWPRFGIEPDDVELDFQVLFGKDEISNVRIVCGDAVGFLHQQVPDRSLDGVRIYFPDPWPKKRHHKRRIIQPGFVALLAKKIRPDGMLHLATDWQDYAEHMLEVFSGSKEFENISDTGDFSSHPEWRPRTKYEKRGQRLGHPVHDLIYRRCK
jgi:tRNA (guanine-N7-)-methyltransferase